jgi:hypothetical protein
VNVLNDPVIAGLVSGAIVLAGYWVVLYLVFRWTNNRPKVRR